jgi:hypothetical protein
LEVRVLPPEQMPDPGTAPSPTPRPARRGSGCLVWIIALPVVVIAGLLIGKALGSDGDAEGDERVTLDSGDLDGVAWRVDAVRDVEGDACAFLYADDEQLTGACSTSPQEATFGARTVVFGIAGPSAEEISVELSDGRAVEIDTVTADGIDGRFYVAVVDGDVDIAP